MHIHMHSGYAFGESFDINFNVNSGELLVNWSDGELNLIDYTFKSKFEAIREYLEDLAKAETQKSQTSVVTVKYVDREHEDDFIINKSKLQKCFDNLSNMKDHGEVEYFLVDGNEISKET